MRFVWGDWGRGAAALVGILVLASSTALAAGTNLVTNGSFESPVVSGTAFFAAPSTGLTGWNLTAGSIDLDNSQVWQAAAGSQSVDLSGYADSPGTISQNVPTTSGEKYLLQFAMSGNPFCGVETVQLTASWGGSAVASPTYDTSQISPSPRPVSNMDYTWHLYVVSGAASAASTPLQFSSLTDSSCGPVLDAVSVTNAYTGICQVVQADSTKAGLANSLCAKLSAAQADGLRGNVKAESGVLNAFANELSAQSGKALTPDQATQIAGLAAQL